MLKSLIPGLIPTRRVCDGRTHSNCDIPRLISKELNPQQVKEHRNKLQKEGRAGKVAEELGIVATFQHRADGHTQRDDDDVEILTSTVLTRIQTTQQ